MTYLGLKFLMDKLKFLISKNFSYVFSVAINVFLCYSTNTVMEKNKWEGGGCRVRIWNFQGY